MRARFYLIKKLLDSEGAAPIYINIHHRSHRLRYYTGERIKPGDWNAEKQRAKSTYIGHASLNGLLDALAEEPKTIERNARMAQIDCTVEYLKGQLSYNKVKSRDFVGVLDEYIKKMSLRKKWPEDTEKNWWFYRNNLVRFNKIYHLEFDSINQHFAQAFTEAMEQHGWSKATIMNHIGKTLQLVSWASKKGYHSSRSYRDIDPNISTQKPDPNDIFLTIEEIARVYRLSFSRNESRYEKARDVFLFSCFTGLRHADLKQLHRTSIKYNYLIIISPKTGESIRVPLVDLALSILDKYKDSGNTNPLPVVSVQKYNEYLKEIGKRAELDKWQQITSHVGPKTYLSIAVYLGIPLETASKINGHKSGEISGYYDISDGQKELEIQKFNELETYNSPH